METRREQPKDSDISEIKLKVEGMDCPDCARTIEKGLSIVEGISDVRVDFLSKTLSVKGSELNTAALQEKIRSLGYSSAPHHENKWTTTILFIPDMDCQDEEKLIRKALRPFATTAELKFNLINKEVHVIHSGSVSDLIEAIAKAGLKVRIVTGGVTKRERSISAWKIWSLLAAIVLISLGELLDLQGASPLLYKGIYLAGITIGGWQIAKKGLLAARLYRLDMNFLMTAAVIGAILLGEWSEAAAVVILFALAQLLESYSLEKSRRAITGLIDLSPKTAAVISDGTERLVALAEVAIGAMVLVRPGERIPVDGIIVDGLSNVNQAAITGESQPKSKKPGDLVYAGTMNQEGALRIRTTHAPGDTTLDKIIHLIEEAQAQKAPSQGFVDRFSAYYTPIVVGLAVLLAILPPLLSGGLWHEWIYRALALLVISCPCALVISTPVTIVSGLANAARNGVLIKGGVYLENLHKIKAIAFDKTGTITTGQPIVKDVIALNGASRNEIIRIAASIESHSEHPIAEAIKNYAMNLKLDILAPRDFKAEPGLGASAWVDGEIYYIGNRAYFSKLEIAPDAVADKVEMRSGDNETSLLLGNRNGIMGIIIISDTVRTNAASVVGKLKIRDSLHIVMLTGDNAMAGRALAEQVGIDEVYTDLLPGQKVGKIKELRARFGEIAMVGDGINDAPALAAATIGIAMGKAGSDATLETADIALMHDDLMKIPWSIRLSRKTHRIIIQNIVLAIGIKAAFVILASLGLATLWMAVFADMGVSLMVIVNGMRALRNG